MSSATELKLLKWPFLIFGDCMLLAIAFLIYAQRGHAPMRDLEMVLFVLCGMFAAVLGVLPFWLEYRSAVKMVETGAMVGTLSQIQNIEEIALQIGAATAQWQNVQEHSKNTANTAKQIAERMAAEVGAFKEFMQKANDTERANLRLEVEKLRRAEGDFLQVIVRMLDHTYALHQAAQRSGQPALIENLGQFQAACRDAARRIGLLPFGPNAGDAFDPKMHRTHESQSTPPEDAKVGDTLSTGLTYQGQLIRQALVSIQALTPPQAIEEASTTIETPELLNGSSRKEQENVEEQTLL